VGVQRDATASILYFISLQDYCTCFGCSLHPSSGVHKTAYATTGASRVMWQVISVIKQHYLEQGNQLLTVACCWTPTKKKNKKMKIFLHNYFPSRVARRPDSGSRPSLRGFAITHTGHTTLSRTPLEEWSARRRNIYLTTHSNYKRQTSLPPRGFEPRIRASERHQTHALHRSASRIGRPKLDDQICIETVGQTVYVIQQW
jgi:hypothetical protein